ncbi:NADH:ubiquinone reductase (Na(+)-transporting) subunit A [Arsenicitalea aurantiaca]|nr:NADH:ubiquinone reductase (Na(+)-transporting) subunit A [Arsenicitalea aurantiaca]
MMTRTIRGGIALSVGTPCDATTETLRLPQTIALLGEDCPGLRPRLAVAEGAEVSAGTLLLEDRHRPEIRLVAPVSGRVVEIVRGPRRSFDRLVIEAADGEARVFDCSAADTREGLVALLVEAGLWRAFLTRPYGRVPGPTDQPDALFVTAIDTRPLAPDPFPIIARRAGAFARGLAALRRLTEGPVHLCHAPGRRPEAPAGILPTAFAGPHPAGLAGTHIHHLHPVGARGRVWHIGYQEVIGIGHLLETGRLWSRRIVGLAGDGLLAPDCLETLPGADLNALARGRLGPDPVRILSGSPINGRPARWLGHAHTQASVLRHRVATGAPDTRGWREALVHWLGRGTGALIPNALHERAAPPGILPIPLLRAISVGDAETARRLGARELAGEDLALLTHIDGGETNYPDLLRRTLELMEATE